jgi:hypothetical protein
LVFAPLSRALVSRMVEGVKGVEVKSIRRNKRSGNVGVVGNGDRSSGEGSGIPVVLLLGGRCVFLFPDECCWVGLFEGRVVWYTLDLDWVVVLQDGKTSVGGYWFCGLVVGKCCFSNNLAGNVLQC